MELNPQQKEAVEHLEGPLLVLAGAGSGKTRVVTLRIARLIERGVDPHHILGVTFTNKAADEMRERVKRQMQADVLISTFHSLGARILRESIQELGYTRGFSIYDEDDSLKVLKASLQDLDVRDRNLSDKSSRKMISAAKNELKGPDQLDPQLVRQYPEMPGVYREYQKRLKDYNAVDFDDLLWLPVRLMAEIPEMRTYYQRKWRFLLVDEYQDTNAAQYRLVRLLVENTQNVFVVGDPDQSIYSWRGADVNNILSFEEDFPGAKVVRLEQNYRSTTTILDASNALINRNHDRYQKSLWSDLGEGDPISRYTADSERDEAEFIARALLRYHAEMGVNLKDIAIFYRTNAQSRILEDVFLQAGVPYVVVGGISFYQRREIKDAVALLRLLDAGTDFVSFTRVINLPKRGIGAAAVERLRQGASEAGLGILDFCEEESLGKIKLNARQKEGLREFTSAIKELRGLSVNMPLSQLVQSVLERSRYLEYLREDIETFEDRNGNLGELITKAAEWEERTGSQSLTEFLEDLSLRSAVDDADFRMDRVNLMTVHNSKGLEFEVVFLAGLEEDLFPHANSRGDLNAQEEERRLCYVGMTRAKRKLTLSHALTRMLWGGRRAMRVSRFLKEIPSEEEEGEVYEYDEEWFPKNTVVLHRDFGLGVVMGTVEKGGSVLYRVYFQNLNEMKEIDTETAHLTRL